MEENAVLKSFEFGKDGHRIVLFDWASHTENQLNNLVCVRDDGGVKWRANLPDATLPDCFVDFEISDKTLVARTWSGYQIKFNLETGKALDVIFVK